MAINKNLLTIQNKFAPGKDATGFNFKYSNLNTILPALKDTKIEYTFMIMGSELISVNQVSAPTTSNKDKMEWQVIAYHMWLLSVGGTDYEIKTLGIGTQNTADQALGSSLTYSRRYTLMNIFNANDGGEYDTGDEVKTAGTAGRGTGKVIPPNPKPKKVVKSTFKVNVKKDGTKIIESNEILSKKEQDKILKDIDKTMSKEINAKPKKKTNGKTNLF